ncbi:unnamed protein product [Penicillium salamii]|uniref:Anaphase-promoting complex, subunit 15/MND2 n=1 Tax=Penicillium salamii TaxID=1612424 RepID=A0A9W4JN22_9EURO|nr:unnamed protein product [Penicillium salamii]CAG8293922.1 unnamed protein product [Penicillium salamii]CAG8368657.1 unnamed protein product [Penicillium salamii]CAG8377442.1 unnamed protein product [Penicillium salamii]CAG8378685.1 unnamed protein product [Penicillium salamii]
MLSLPSLTPRDSHELWFGTSQPHSEPTDPANPFARRNAGSPSHRAFLPSRSPGNTLAALAAEERKLRARKLHIASFGYSWIRPAGCAKTMLGMKEEEAEREEAMQAAAAEMEAAEGGILDDTTHPEEEGMERDLDEEIPNAEEEPSGLIEEGEEGLEEEGEYMERDLDDDIPEGFVDDEYEGSGLYDDDDDDDFDNQPDLDADIPEESERDLDDEIPDAEGSPEEWQHTDSEEELSEDDSSLMQSAMAQSRFTENFPTSTPNFRTSTPNSRGGLPPPTLRRGRETEAQSRFINRWSGGGDAFDSSSMLYSDGDLRASVTSQSSRRSGFGRLPRHIGGPRDSLN